MKDKLKQRFENLTDQSLEVTPTDGHRSRFEQRLKEQHSIKPKGIQFSITYKLIRSIAVAAVVVIAVTFAWLMNGSKVTSPNTNGTELNEGMNLAAISDKYRDVEFFYIREVNSKLKLIENSGSDTENLIYREAISKLDKLESNYLLLEKNLASNPDNLRVINAMIQNYQLRIKVLETLYKKLEINQTLKINEDEKANNNDHQSVGSNMFTYTA
jgi:anti-sigma-K factor RskA